MAKRVRVESDDEPGVYFDSDGVVEQVSFRLTPDGRFELPDPVPMEPPLGYSAPPSLTDLIRTMVRNEVFMKAMAAEDFETFEESDDFDIEDDPLDPLTPYEKVFEPPAAPVSQPQVGGKPGEGSVAAPPPVEVSTPGGVLVPGSVVSSGEGSAGIQGKVNGEGSK